MIQVRNAVMADAERILEIYDYYVQHTAISFEYTTPTLAEFRGRMEKTMARYPYLVVEQEGIVMDIPMPVLLWDGQPMTGPAK